MSDAPAVYCPRNPKISGWYRCVEDYFQEFVRVYDERFAAKFGFWRPHIEKVIHRFLDCGDLHNGFARVKCGDCGHEFFVPFSCKGRNFCPSCHQKRVVEFGEFLCTEVLAKVPHRHIVFSLPKIVRRNFLYDRKLLGKLSRCAWECLDIFLRASCPGDESLPGAVVAIQTFGDLLAFHPHCHILVTDGCFQGENGFTRASSFDWDKLEELFKHKVFQMLVKEGRITEEFVEKIETWHHSGFHVFCGEPIEPDNKTSMENLARYIIRASLSQERMIYLEDEGKVIYQAKDGAAKKEFSALEWLANVCSHIPNPGEHMIRYYGYYSNVARGKRQKKESDSAALTIHEPLTSKKEFRRNWARLIQKIYEVDPLLCPKCGGEMRIISFIEDQAVIEKILKHLGLWLINSRPPPQKPASMVCEDAAEYFPPPEDFFPDPDHSWDEYS